MRGKGREGKGREGRVDGMMANGRSEIESELSSCARRKPRFIDNLHQCTAHRLVHRPARGQTASDDTVASAEGPGPAGPGHPSVALRWHLIIESPAECLNFKFVPANRRDGDSISAHSFGTSELPSSESGFRILNLASA
eukprot:758577-Hanusia_phi.AAC.6